MRCKDYGALILIDAVKENSFNNGVIIESLLYSKQAFHKCRQFKAQIDFVDRH